MSKDNDQIIEEFSSALSNINNKIALFKASNDTFKTRLIGTLGAMNTKIKSLVGNTALQAIKGIKEELSKKTKDLSETNAELQSTKTKLTECQQQLVDIGDKMNKCSASLSENEEKIQQLEQSKGEIEAKIQEGEKYKTISKNVIDELKSQLKTTEQQIEELKKSNGELTNAKTEMETKISSFDAQQKSLVDNIVKSTKELTGQIAAIDNISFNADDTKQTDDLLKEMSNSIDSVLAMLSGNSGSSGDSGGNVTTQIPQVPTNPILVRPSLTGGIRKKN